MKKLTAIIAIMMSIHGVAQLPSYYVYLVKGKATLINSQNQSVELKQKMFIYQSDLLELKKGSEITLVDKNYKYFVLNTEGKSRVQDLSNILRNRNSNSITQKYFALLWNELLNPNYDYSKLKKDNLGGVNGGISRDASCHTLIFPTDGLKAAEDSIHFSWHRPQKNIIDTLFIYDEQGKIIFREPLADTQKILAIPQFTKNSTGNYYWAIRNDGGGCESDPAAFSVMDKEEEQRVLSTLTSNKSNMDILDHLQVVAALEKKKWIYTARKYFANLVRTNKENKVLLESYILFLLNYAVPRI